MNYYMDCEFDEDGKTIELISIGIVRGDGVELYLESYEYDPAKCNDWVKANVLPHLTGASASRSLIRQTIEQFIGDDPSPVFWGWFCAYDWVVFCQLWGPMIAKPKTFPYYCNDLQQLAAELYIRELDVAFPQTGDRYPRHVAIGDARWNKDVHQKLLEIEARDLENAEKHWSLR